jgi:hypothetical protein
MYMRKVSDKKISWSSRLGIRRDADIITLQKLNCPESPVKSGEEGEGRGGEGRGPWTIGEEEESRIRCVVGSSLSS